MPNIEYSESMKIDIGLPDAVFENAYLTPRDIGQIQGWIANVLTATGKLYASAGEAGYGATEVRVFAYSDHSLITARAVKDATENFVPDESEIRDEMLRQRLAGPAHGFVEMPLIPSPTHPSFPRAPTHIPAADHWFAFNEDEEELDPNGIPGARPTNLLGVGTPPDADEILARINPTPDVELGRVMNKLDADGIEYEIVYPEDEPLAPEDIAGSMRAIFAAGLDPARQDAQKLAKLKEDVDAKEEATLCGCDRPSEHRVDSPARAAVEDAGRPFDARLAATKDDYATFVDGVRFPPKNHPDYDEIVEHNANPDDDFNVETLEISVPLTMEGISGIDEIVEIADETARYLEAEHVRRSLSEDEDEAMDYDEAMSYSDLDCDCGDVENHARADRALASKLGPAGWEYANGSGLIPNAKERDQIERLTANQVTLRAQLIEIEDAIMRIRYPENIR
jgi:hypothetical protein